MIESFSINNELSKPKKTKRMRFFVNFLILFFILFPQKSSAQIISQTENLLNNSFFAFYESFRDLGISGIEIMSSLGNGSIFVYQMQGEIVWNSLKNAGEIGDSVIIVHNFAGLVVYTGLKETVIYYGNVFGNISSIDQDPTPNNIFADYQYNVLGGVGIVNGVFLDTVRNTMSEISTFLNPLVAKTRLASIGYVDNVSEGFDFVIDSSVKNSVSGSKKIAHGVASGAAIFSNNFYSNINSIASSVSSLTEMTKAGFVNLFVLDFLNE